MRNHNSRGNGNRNNRYNNNSNHQNNNNNHNNDNNDSSGSLITLNIRGWTNSRAASNPDGGVKSLHDWLEHKSSHKIVNANRRNDTYVISVNSNHLKSFIRLNGYSFANAILSVENVSNNNGNNNQQNNQNNQQNNRDQNGQSTRGGRNSQNNSRQNGSMQTDSLSDTAGADKVEEVLIRVIRSRYDAGYKLLNLQNLPAVADFQEIGLTSQPASKVFSAIFVCCETKVFETPLKRTQMVESLSLAENGLLSVKDCIAAAGTFNTIKNLDLGKNQIADVGELRYWRNRFPNLEHLILEGNPCDGPDTLLKMKQWYPKLKLYNRQPIEQIAQAQPEQTLLPQAKVAALELLPVAPHPELDNNSNYGQPAPGKPSDLVMREQMALRFSYQTRLELSMSEQCLQANGFNYQVALNDLQTLMNKGLIKDSHFLWAMKP